MAKFEDLDILKIGNSIQLAGALWIGEGKNYLCLFPEESLTSDSFEVLEMNSDQWVEFLRQSDLLETEVLTKASDGSVTKAILRKSARQVAQQVSWSVYLRDNWKCRYCGAGPGIPLTVDHLVLWESGGPSIPGNLLSACKKCNKARGNTPYAEWLQSKFYRRVSQGLSALVRQDNLDIVPTLDAIPRNLHKPSKRK